MGNKDKKKKNEKKEIQKLFKELNKKTTVKIKGINIHANC
jgi:hypothetical protein